MMADARCPFCHGAGHVTRLDIAIVIIWVLLLAFPSLPATVGGLLVMSWGGLVIWRWSGRPPKETPTRCEGASTSSRHGPHSGTHVMPLVNLPPGYVPPSAAVGTSLTTCARCGEPFSGAVTMLWLDGKTYHQRCAR